MRVVLAGLLLPVLLTAPVHAHGGGGYRDPGVAVPPGSQEPADPPPPAEPDSPAARPLKLSDWDEWRAWNQPRLLRDATRWRRSPAPRRAIDCRRPPEHAPREATTAAARIVWPALRAIADGSAPIDRELRDAVLTAFARTGAPDADVRLIDAADELSATPADDAAILGLGILRSEATSTLRRARLTEILTRDGPVRRRSAAALALSLPGADVDRTDRAWTHLVEVLAGPDTPAELRAAAAASLCVAPDSGNIEALRRFLGSPKCSGPVRVATLLALGRSAGAYDCPALDADAAVDALLGELAEARGDAGETAALREAAAVALGAADRASEPRLAAALGAVRKAAEANPASLTSALAVWSSTRIADTETLVVAERRARNAEDTNGPIGASARAVLAWRMQRITRPDPAEAAFAVTSLRDDRCAGLLPEDTEAQFAAIRAASAGIPAARRRPFHIAAAQLHTRGAEDWLAAELRDERLDWTSRAGAAIALAISDPRTESAADCVLSLSVPAGESAAFIDGTAAAAHLGDKNCARRLATSLADGAADPALLLRALGAMPAPLPDDALSAIAKIALDASRPLAQRVLAVRALGHGCDWCGDRTEDALTSSTTPWHADPVVRRAVELLR